MDVSFRSFFPIGSSAPHKYLPCREGENRIQRRSLALTGGGRKRVGLLSAGTPAAGEADGSAIPPWELKMAAQPRLDWPLTGAGPRHACDVFHFICPVGVGHIIISSTRHL